METVGWWWNGRWGRMARRDVWLKHDPATGEWWAEARKGDGDSRVWRHPYAKEYEARAVVDGLLKRGSVDWRDMSNLPKR